jgi:hypothetical protein
MTTVLVALASPVAAANLIFRGYEVGNDVLFTIEGTLDLTGMTFLQTGNFGTGIAPSEGRYALGTGGAADVYSTGLSSVPAFGTGLIQGPGIGTGGVFSITDIGADGIFDIAVEAGFVSGSTVDETLRFENSTLAGLGVFTSFSADVTVKVVDLGSLPSFKRLQTRRFDSAVLESHNSDGELPLEIGHKALLFQEFVVIQLAAAARFHFNLHSGGDVHCFPHQRDKQIPDLTYR